MVSSSIIKEFQEDMEKQRQKRAQPQPDPPVMPAPYKVFPFEKDQITFREADLGTVQPGLADAQGFKLSADELRKIFGIEKSRFGDLPKRFVVPELEGNSYKEQWFEVKGFLYQVEPIAWVPVVESEGTIPVSSIKAEYEKKEVFRRETYFNASTSASLNIGAGGSYGAITASAKSDSNVSFEVKESSDTTQTTLWKGETGDRPIHKLLVYPLLRCRVIKSQEIYYTVNNKSYELKWPEGEEVKRGKRWEVSSRRLHDVRRLQICPVPMKGWAVSERTQILPVPKVENGHFSVTTLMSRHEWKDWCVYNVDWKDVESEGLTKDFSVPDSRCAFRPTYTVYAL